MPAGFLSGSDLLRFGTSGRFDEPPVSSDWHQETVSRGLRMADIGLLRVAVTRFVWLLPESDVTETAIYATIGTRHRVQDRLAFQQ